MGHGRFSSFEARKSAHLRVNAIAFIPGMTELLLARREGIAMGIYVYMLRCADGSFYVGSATGDDLATRIDQHNAGTFPGYTSKRRPVILVWSEFFDRITEELSLSGKSRVGAAPRRRR